MDLDPPARADDVAWDLGPYARSDIVKARRALLAALSDPHLPVLQRLRHKLGILHQGQSWRFPDPEPSWLPPALPPFWCAPVALHPPQGGPLAGPWHELQELTLGGSHEDDVPSGSESVRHRKSGSKPLLAPASRASSSSSAASTAPAVRDADTGGPCHSTGNADPTPFGDPDPQESSPWQPQSSLRWESGSGQTETEGSSSTPCPPTSQGDGGDDVPPTAPPAADGSSAPKRRRLETELDSSAALHSSSEKRVKSSVNYEALFLCDLCSKKCHEEEGMAGHLADAGHHSASRYLALRHPATGRLKPKYLAQASALKDQSHVFKGKVPACPECHEVFADLQQCVQHSARWHGAGGAYSLRSVLKAQTLPTSAAWECCDCGEEFDASGLLRHVAHTKHMRLHRGQWGPRAMMLFPCPFCGLLHSNYFTFRRHVRSAHAREEGLGGAALVGYTLSRAGPVQHLLPRDPGDPTHSDPTHSDPTHSPAAFCTAPAGVAGGSRVGSRAKKGKATGNRGKRGFRRWADFRSQSGATPAGKASQPSTATAEGKKQKKKQKWKNRGSSKQGARKKEAK